MPIREGLSLEDVLEKVSSIGLAPEFIRKRLLPIRQWPSTPAQDPQVGRSIADQNGYPRLSQESSVGLQSNCWQAKSLRWPQHLMVFALRLREQREPPTSCRIHRVCALPRASLHSSLFGYADQANSYRPGNYSSRRSNRPTGLSPWLPSSTTYVGPRSCGVAAR